MQVIDWDEYINPGSSSFTRSSLPLAVTIGVFDGVHRGHQALIQQICEPRSSLYTAFLPTVVTFRENPLKILQPDTFTGDIYTLEQKLHTFQTLGVGQVILIDFNRKFSKINGRDFIDLLINSRPVKLIVLGRNFRCGHQLDAGIEEIQDLADTRGVEVLVVPPVMDEGLPVSSSRIRQAFAAGRIAEAERLMARPDESIVSH